MGASRDLGYLFKKLYVFRSASEFIIADQRPERRSAEDAEFFFIDLLEESALIEF